MTNRRADGEGSIYQLPNGKWKVVISLGFDADGNGFVKRRRRLQTTTAKCLKELKDR